MKMKPIKKTVKKAVDYILDSAKMGDESLVFAHHVDLGLVAVDFSEIRAECLGSRPNKQKSQNENLAYHIIQSHPKSDKVTPTVALEIAKKTMADYTQDYGYVIAVHTDKDHIHTHVLVNAYSHTGKQKLNNYRSIEKLVAISNKHCLAHGLSTSEIKRKTPAHKQAKKQFREYEKQLSGRDKLKHLIDEMIVISKDFDEFIDNIQDVGVEVRDRGGLSFLLPDAKRPIRISSFNDELYDTVEMLQYRIKNKDMEQLKNHDVPKTEIPKIKTKSQQKWINYYSRDYWRRKSDNLANITKIAKMLNHMRENKIEKIADYNSLLKVANKEVRLVRNEIAKLEKHFDELEVVYLATTASEQEVIAEQMKAIRNKIRPLNKKSTTIIGKRDELEEFKQMFERESVQSQNQKHEKERKL